MKKYIGRYTIAVVLCGFLGFTACGTQTPKESAAASLAATTTPTQEPTTPTLTPFPDDAEMREYLNNMPDSWNDWIPENEPVYIVGVKPNYHVCYDIHKSPSEMKQYFEQCLSDSEWGDGEWNGYNYTLSKHNPRMKMNITISGSSFEGQSRITVFQEYREEDGY